MKKTLLSGIALQTVLFTFAGSVFAHAIWIEKDASGAAAVYFGEYADGLREKSGGKLDGIAHLEARSASGELRPSKEADRFSLGAAQGNVTAQDVRGPVKDMTKYKLGVVKPYFYARFADAPSSGAVPALRLDPMLESADTARVYFDSKPLAGEKAVFIAPNGWSKELKTDEEGRVKLSLPWPGLYVLEVTHVLEAPGRFDGVEYAAERHRSSLSFEKK